MDCGPAVYDHRNGSQLLASACSFTTTPLQQRLDQPWPENFDTYDIGVILSTGSNEQEQWSKASRTRRSGCGIS